MKRNKLIIVMISVIAIGLFALPSTFSYSGSMHTFKQIAIRILLTLSIHSV